MQNARIAVRLATFVKNNYMQRKNTGPRKSSRSGGNTSRPSSSKKKFDGPRFARNDGTLSDNYSRGEDGRPAPTGGRNKRISTANKPLKRRTEDSGTGNYHSAKPESRGRKKPFERTTDRGEVRLTAESVNQRVVLHVKLQQTLLRKKDETQNHSPKALVRIKSTAKEDHQAAARVKVRVIHLKAEEGRPKSPSERVLKATRGLVKENQQAAHHAKQQTGPTIKKKQAQESHLPGVVQTEIKNSAAKEDHQAALHVKQEMTLMRNAVPDSEVQDDQPAMLMKGPLNVNPHVSHTANRNLVVTKKLPEVAENSHPTHTPARVNPRVEMQIKGPHAHLTEKKLTSANPLPKEDTAGSSRKKDHHGPRAKHFLRNRMKNAAVKRTEKKR
jgi:hypothetical protein